MNGDQSASGRGQDVEEGHGRGTEGTGLERSSCKVEETETVAANSAPSEDLVRGVLREMWRYCRAYHISNSVSLGCVVCGRGSNPIIRLASVTRVNVSSSLNPLPVL